MRIGYQKRMYFVKDTGSRFFNEAYFILKDGAELSPVSENDLAAEADRILREKFPVKSRKFHALHFHRAAYFILGLIAGIAFMGIIL